MVNNKRLWALNHCMQLAAVMALSLGFHHYYGAVLSAVLIKALSLGFHPLIM